MSPGLDPRHCLRLMARCPHAKALEGTLSFPRELSLLDMKSDSICTLPSFELALETEPRALRALGLCSAFELHPYLSISMSNLMSLFCYYSHMTPSCPAYDFRALLLGNGNLTLAVLVSSHEKRRREVWGTQVTGGNRCSIQNSREAHLLPGESIETDGLGQLSTRIMANRRKPGEEEKRPGSRG